MTMGQLAGSLAHELRQPLAAIAMNGSAALRWLNRESPDLGEVREAAERIVGDAHRADEVIQGLRALVGESTPLREALDMNDAVHQVLELARGELRRNAVAVHADVEPILPPALGDRVQLQQVMLNLILNAMEAMAPITDHPRELVIRTARGAADDVVVTVEDTGPGLDAVAMPRIFDAFFSTKPHGLGMGLSICRSIVEAHGGTLSVVPRSPRGTAFRFTVPTFVDEAKSSQQDDAHVR
jgi:signal transduction histidine kinase